MWPRRQLPVYSPIGLGALGDGLAAALRGDESVRTEVLDALRSRFPGADIVLTDSGTSALALALRAAGGPAAIPAYCCFDIATACDAAAVAPILYDVDPHTLAPVPESLDRALDAGARSVVVVHLFGIPVPMAAIAAAAARTGAAVIEDAAQGSGGSISGRPLGNFGDLAVLSFGRGKGVTGGGGGALIVRAARLRDVSRELTAALPAARRASPSDVIATAAQWGLARPSLYGVPASLPFLGLGATVYRRPWAATGISAFSLGVLRRSLAAEPTEAERRHSHAERLREMLVRVARPAVAPAASDAAPMRAGYLRLPVLAESSTLRSSHARALGILPSYPTSLADLEGFRARVKNRHEGFDGARRLAGSLVTFPTHSRLGERDFAAIEALLGESSAPRRER